MTRLKAKTTCFLVVKPLPPPLGVERPTPTLVIVFDWVSVGVANRPLVMEN